MATLNRLRSLVKGTGPETDFSLRDIMADCGGVVLMGAVVLAAMLA